jgi:4-alpha-glucanotransferase
MSDAGKATDKDLSGNGAAGKFGGAAGSPKRGSLADLAERAGLAAQWEDAHGNEKQVKEETLRALLGKLGLPCETPEQIAESIAQLDEEMGGRSLPPLITAQAGEPVTLPPLELKPGARYRVELEQGGKIEGVLSSRPGEPPRLAPIAETGYHKLIVGEHETRLAVAPQRCFQVADALGEPEAPARAWGVGAQLYGLRRRGDGGLGDYTALAQLARKAARRGAASVALSPVHAMFSAQPEKISPYSPSSRLYLNVLHIDPAAQFGADALASVIDELGLADELAALDKLDLVDWPRAGRARLAILRSLFERFTGQQHDAMSTAAREFEAFCAAGGAALTDHARFEAIHAELVRRSPEFGHWRNWPEELRDPHHPAVAAFASEHAHEVDFHLFLQWLAAKGLDSAQQAARQAGMALGLIADLAVGCDSAGSHAWSYRSDMLDGVSVGAPPDLFNQAGQSWGLTTFSPRAMRMQGFSAFIDMVRAAFAHAGGIRIDHILGLRRLWLVPEGSSAADGAYLQYPLEDLLRLIALESWRHRAIVVGEDLGTVPPGFRERLADAGLLGIRVLWFERDEDGFTAPGDWSDAALATSTTHDLPTVAGWWTGDDITWRARIGQAGGEDAVAKAHEARAKEREELWQALGACGVAAADAPPPAQPPVDEAMQFVARTPAPLVSYPLEDLLGLAEQPNLPGSIDEHPNWRRRLSPTVDALFDEPAVADRIQSIVSNRRRS